MQPAIGESIREGFKSANRSWKGMLLFAAGSLVLGGLVMGIFALTGVPDALVEPELQTEETFEPAYDPDTGEELALTAEDEALQEEVADWFGRWWPVLMLAILILVAGSLWLNGGQIGYVAHVVRNQETELPVFWTSASRAFLPLLGAWGLSIAAALVIALVFGVLSFVFVLLEALPAWLLTVLGLALALAVMGALVWLAVRLVFWFIAIVADGRGPLDALKASFALTQGQWWPVFGLVVLLGVISMAAGFVVQAVQGLGGLIGGPVGGAIGFVAGLAGIAANLYIGFAGIAAFVYYYEASKNRDVEAPAGFATV